MRVWSSNPLAFNCGAALYSLQRATEAAKPFPMWESSKQPVVSLAGGGGPGDPKPPEWSPLVPLEKPIPGVFRSCDLLVVELLSSSAAVFFAQ